VGAAGVVFGAPLTQARHGVLAEGLEQAVARLLAVPLGREQRRVDESAHERDGTARGTVVGEADGCGGTEVERPDEDGESLEERPLGIGQERVTRIHRRLERAVAGRCAHRRQLQESESLVEMPNDLLRRQDGQTGGGHLDRQRQAVEPPAHLQHGRRIAGVEHERGVAGTASLDEQAHGVELGELGRRRLSGRKAERRHRPHEFSFDMQRRATGREHARAGGPAHDCRHELGGRGCHVLAVVDKQEHSPPAERADDGCDDLVPRHDRQAEDARRLIGDQAGVSHRREIDPHSAGEPRAQPLGNFHRQPGLADPARPGQGQESVAVDEVRHLLQLAIPAHERGKPGRQVARRLGRFERELGSLQQDPAIEIADLRSKLDPEVGAESILKGACRLERFGLAPAAVERQHQLRVEAFVVRMLRHERAQLGDELAVPAER
jgi:hypothetical protein